MAQSMNWGEVEKSVKEAQRARGGGRRLFLSDGDDVDLRLIGAGTGKEPFIYKRHYDGKTGRYFVCAEDAAKAGDHEGCVCCAVARVVRAEGKSARLKSPQLTFVVSVFDKRRYHFVEAKPKGEQYQECAGDDSCRYCRKNIEQKINGVRYWEMAQNVMEQVRGFEAKKFGLYCARCQEKSIKRTGFQCPVCEEELDPDDPSGEEEIRCFSCEKEMGKRPVLRKPRELVTCKNCGPKGRRVTLADAWLNVSISGTKQSKTWNFTVGDIGEFDPDPYLKEFKDLKKIAPLHFREMSDFEPMSAAEQAAALGVKNPFGKSRRDREDEDEDDEVEYTRKGKKRDEDDEEEDEEPRRKRAKTDDEDEEMERSRKRRGKGDEDDERDHIFD